MHCFHDSRTETRKVVYLTDSDIWNGLRASQIPESLKVAIFVLTTDAERRQTKPIT